MITVTGSRFKGNEKFDFGSSKMTKSKALESLVTYELSFGGVIQELEGNRIVIETRVLGCIDTTVFEGPTEDMELLVGVATNHILVLQTLNNGHPVTDKEVNCILKATGGSPLKINALTDIIVGQNRSSLAIVSLLLSWYPNQISEELIITLLKTKVPDLVAILQMIQFENIPLSETLSLLH